MALDEHKPVLTKGQRTRARLVAATLEVIRESGIAGLTTGRIASHAGLAQSSFYQHFRNLDECLEQAGRHVAERIRPPLPQLPELALTGFESEQDLGPLIALLMEQTLQPYLRHPELTKLYQRYQHDPSPFGRAMDTLVARERAALTAIWWEAAQRLGAGPELYPVVALQAELVIAMAQGAIRTLIHGQFQNQGLVLAQLRVMIEGGVRANLELLRRMRPPSA